MRPRWPLRYVFVSRSLPARHLGVPVEMLFDQMQAVVLADGRHSGGRLGENPGFRGFSDHWGFRIRACRP